MSLEDILITALMTPVWMRGKILTRYKRSWGLPIVLRGNPGGGKSTKIDEIGERLEMMVCTFAVETADTEDFDGLVVKTPDGKLQRLSDNEDMLTMMQVGEGIVFLDETNTPSTRSLGAALNRVLLDRLWLKKRMPPGIRVLGAMNPPHLSAGGKPLAASTLNRICLLDAPSISRRAYNDYVNTDLPEEDAKRPPKLDVREQLLNGWAENFAHISSLVEAYMETSPGSLEQVPTEDKVHLNRPYPTARSWHASQNFLVTSRCLGLLTREDELEVISGCLGEGVATEFHRYMRSADLPSVKDVLSRKWRPSTTTRTDVMYAVTVACLRHLKSPAFLAADAAIRESMAFGALSFCKDLVDLQMKDVCYDVYEFLTSHGFGLRYALMAKTDQQKALSTIIRDVSASYDIRTYRQADAS